MALKLIDEKTRETLRGKALAQTLTRVGRMLTGEQGMRVNYGTDRNYYGYGQRMDASQPCTTTASGGWATITFNPDLVPLKTSDDYVRAVGLFYHQVAHGLFTVRPSWMQSVTPGSGPHNAWNLLEDQRIEVLMHAMYPSVAPYLVADVVKYVLQSTNSENGANPLFNAYGRIVGVDYLPADLITRARQAWADRHGDVSYRDEIKGINVTQSYAMAADRLAELVDEYQQLTFPRDNGKSEPIVSTYANILARAGAHTKSQHGDGEPGGEQSAGRNGNQQSSQRQNQAQQQRTDDKNAEKGQGQGDKGKDADGGQGEGQGNDQGKGEQPGQGQGQGQGEGQQPGQGQGQGAGEGQGEPGEGQGQGQGAGQGQGEGDGQGQGSGQTGQSNDDQATGEGDGAAATAGQGGSGAGTGGYKSAENWYADDINTRKGLHEALENLLDSASAEMTTSVNRLRNGTRKLPDYTPAGKRVAKPETLLDASKYAKNIKRLTADVEPGWNRRLDSGRLNTQRAMSGEVPLDELFDRWDDGKVDETRVETVVLVDTSGSMDRSLQAVVESAWAIKRAGDELRHPVTVVLFGSYSRVLFTPDDRVHRSQVPTVDNGGGTDPLDAIQYAANVFEQSTIKHKTLITLTDGAWSNSGACDEIIGRMNKAGIVTGLINYGGGSNGSHNHQVVVGSNSTTAIGDLAKKLATQAVKKAVGRG